MKKMILFLMLMLFFLVSCEKNEIQEDATTTAKNSEINIVATTETLKATEKKQSTTTNISNTTIKTPPSTSSSIEEVPSYNVVDLDIPKMKAALEASKTMSDTEFEKYLALNYPYAHNCEFTTPETYGAYIKDVSKIPLAVVDNNYGNVNAAYYYLGNNNVTQVVYVDETCRFVVDINPLVVFEENEKTVLKKSIKISGFSADIFWSDVWDLYTGNIYINDEIYTFRAYEMDNLDMVETNLTRLSFVKIGDLLNEVSIATTIPEAQITPETDVRITE